FFQAEDGIRDRNVTGVQTCALPISFPLSCEKVTGRPRHPLTSRAVYGDQVLYGAHGSKPGVTTFGLCEMQRPVCGSSFAWGPVRSEERRVGKEWRSRWWREHGEKMR